MSKKYTNDELEQLFGLPYLQSLVDSDLNKYGYISSKTLTYLGNTNIVIDSNMKVRRPD